MTDERDHITIRDLIYLYLRELELVQKSIERLETDLRQHCTMNNDDYNKLSDEIKDLKDIVNEVSKNFTQLINDAKIKSVKSDSRILTLEQKVTIYGAIGGILSFIGSELCLKLISFIFNN